MKSSATISLGIDIAASEINAVVLKRTREGLRMLGAARTTLPDGTIEGGRVVDPTGLIKGLRIATDGCRRQTHSVLSMPSDGILTRIIPLEEEDPQEIARFVHEEIEQYAAFSGRKTAHDFRVTAAARKNVPGKVVAAAIDRATIEALTHACRNAGVNARVVEPPIMACVRLVRAATSREKLGPNVLLALLKDNALTLGLLQKNTLDFIRIRSIDANAATAIERYDRVAEEINAVVRFYAVKGTTVSGVVLVDDNSDLTSIEAGQEVRSKVLSETVEIWTRSNLPEYLPIEPGINGKGSVISVGLAMRSLVDQPINDELNLLANVADRATAMQRNAVLTAIALAALLPVVTLATGGIRWMVGRMNDSVAAMDQAELERGDHSLPVAVVELSEIEQRMAFASGQLNCLTRVSQQHLDFDWQRLLDDVRAAVPAEVRLTELSVDNTAAMQIEAVSRSEEAVATLVANLNGSDLIAQAELLRVNRYDGVDAPIRYAIACTLGIREER